MKKFTILVVLGLVVGLFGGVKAASVCPECDTYKYECIVPYITAQSSGWWTGIAVTNTSGDEALLRLDYVNGGKGFVQRVDVPAQTVQAFIAEVDCASYARLRSNEPLYVQVMIGNRTAMQGYSKQLHCMAPPAPATCVGVGIAQ